MCRAHIVLQEHQAGAMMLHRMAFYLSGKVFGLQLDYSTAETYLCNQDGTVSPFLSRLACWILSLTDKCSITFIPVYIPTHLNVEANYLLWGWWLLEWHFLSQTAQAASCLWGLPEMDIMASSHTTQYKCYYTLETPCPSGGLRVECLQPSLDVSGKLYVSSSCISFTSSVQVSGRTCQEVNSDLWFWGHHIGWSLLGFPQFSTWWQTFLSTIPS